MAKEKAVAAESKAALALDASRRTEVELALDKAQLLGERGDAHLALLWLAHSLELVPEDTYDLPRFIRLTLGAWQKRVSPLRLLIPHQERADKLAFDSDGKNFFTAARLQHRGILLQKWNAENGEAPGNPIEHLAGMVYAQAFSRDAERLAISYIDGRCEIIHCAIGQIRPLALFPITGAITAMNFQQVAALLLSP